MKFLIDTDIFIDNLRGIKNAELFIDSIRKKENELIFSAVTEAEVLAGKECEAVERINRAILLLSIADKKPVDNRVAFRAGELRRKYGVSLQDALIAATAMVENATLCSRNLQDFRRISGLKVKKSY